MRSKYTKYCLVQNNYYAKVSQEDIKSRVGVRGMITNYLQRSEVNHWKFGITLNIDGGKDKLFIGYNILLEDGQEMEKWFKRLNNMESKLFNALHNSQTGQKESEINQEDEEIFNLLQLNLFNINMNNKKMSTNSI